LEIFWTGHASFKIKTENGKIIYLDPYQLGDNEEKADIVVASHSHFDHFSKGDIEKIRKESTLVLGPESIARNLKKFNGKGLKIGEIFEIDDIKIELVPSYTIKKPTHPKSSEWVGTIIEYGGKTVYHVGDSERIPEMKELAKRNLTVALIPCGGTYTMDFEESTDSTVDINPEIAVPMHKLYIDNV